MQIQRYETLMLSIPEITNDESQNLEKAIDKKLQDFKGKLISYDRWGKYLLTYPIKRNDYGVYFLARFDIPGTKKNDFLKELDQLLDLKFTDIIMRHLTSHIDKEAPLDYKRPQAFDETPKDVDQFLKENKMTGITPKGRSSQEEGKSTSTNELKGKKDDQEN